ncbi:MAG: type VI secretion system contractile sheath large subunit [Amphritea sp.]
MYQENQFQQDQLQEKQFQQDWQQAFNGLDSDDDEFLLQALELLRQLDDSMLQSPAVLKANLNRIIARLDRQLSEQLSAIIHNPEYEALEAGWLNLRSLVDLPVNYQRVSIKLLDISWQELSQDLNTSNTLRRSVLYNHIGNRELNTLGGQPFGMVVVDHGISMEMGYDDLFDDLYTLELLGRLGEICLCPFILSPAEDFFGESGADWMSDIRRVGKILEGPDYTGWQHLRESTGSRFLGLALPQIQLRKAYSQRQTGFMFNESSVERPGLWGSAAFAFASIAIREFNRISWFGFMKSRWQELHQGALINLPANTPKDSCLQRPQPAVKLFGNLAGFYAEQGFIPICHSPMTDKYFFYGNNSVWQPGLSEQDRVSCQLQVTLMSCRIAHYLKVQIRGMIGSFQTASECELHLSRWLDDYSSNLVDANESMLAKYPLSNARVTVKEQQGQGSHGRFICEVLMQPQYQFDHFSGEVLLSTDLGEAAVSRRAS